MISARSVCLILFFIPLLHSFAQDPGGNPSERIQRALAEQGLIYQKRPHFAAQGGFGTSIHVDFTKTIDPSATGKSLAVAVPLRKNPGKTELDFDAQAALALCAKLSRLSLDKDVRVVFLDDEASSLPPAFRTSTHLGLRDLLSRYEDSEDVMVLYMDIPEAPIKTVAHHGSEFGIAPLNMISPLPKLFEQQGISMNIAIPYNELYRLGLIRGPEALRLLHGQETKAVYLGSDQDIRKGKPAPPVSIHSFSDALLAYAATVESGETQEDFHYSVIPNGFAYIYLTEFATILLFLAAAAISLTMVLVYSITHRIRLLAHWSLFIRRSWVIVFYLGLLLLGRQASVVLFGFIRDRFGAGLQYPEYGTAIIQSILFLSFFNLASPALRLLHIPDRARFYGSASVLLLAIATILGAGLDISLFSVFLWPFLFVYTAAVLKARYAVYLCALLAPARILASLGAAMGSGEPVLARLFLSPNLTTGLTISFILLPFIFIFKRARLLAAIGRSPSGKALLLAPRIAMVLGTIAALFSFVLREGVVSLAPNASEPTAEGPYSAGPNAAAPTAAGPDAAAQKLPIRRDAQDDLLLDVREETFLDRKFLSISLTAKDSPLKFEVQLQGTGDGSELVVYEAPMPYESAEDGSAIRLILGEGPPNPFSTKIVVPRLFAGTVHAKGLFSRRADGPADAPATGTVSGTAPADSGSDSGVGPSANLRFFQIERTAGIGAKP